MELYLVSEGDAGPIKIRRSVNADSRLASLQTGNPRPLRVLRCYRMPAADVIEAEQMLHEELRDFSLVGEWFDLSERFILQYMPDFFLANGLRA
jgi:hypothetical protein